MGRVTRLARALDRFVVGIGRIAAWAGLLLVLVTVFDVVTRNLSQSSWTLVRELSAVQQRTFGSTMLQDLEWHLHAVLFLFCLGYAYVKGAHVRIDFFHERLGERARSWIEITGICLFLLPFCVLVTVYGVEFAASSFTQDEGSASGGGLPHRWIVKSALPAGIALLATAAVAALLHRVAALRKDRG
jgi:TRAP-type mannitol/chloroaromatic compound transport system permease small subunit